MELTEAQEDGFVSRYATVHDGTLSKKKLLGVLGIITTFGHKKNRDAIRKAWMPTGAALKKLETEKGIVVRYVIGRSTTAGDSLDWEVDNESMQNDDFMILDKCSPCMTAYKLVTVDASYWGFGRRIEQALISGEKALFLETHHHCFFVD